MSKKSYIGGTGLMWHKLQMEVSMALYLASYDIPEKDRDEYQELWDYFKQLSAVRILYSEFAVPFEGRALDLAGKILKRLKPADRLLVCELFGGTGDTLAWRNLIISDEDFRVLIRRHARALN
jgi:hypothetical protein